MKAYHIYQYGDPEKVLTCKEVEKPVPKETEVLIKIHATAINDYEWCLATGKPYAYRFLFGLFKPKKKMMIPGMELSGKVEQVGQNAKLFKVGDSVYGDTSGYGFGSFAEYMCVDEKALTHKPSGMSFEEAASIPHAAMLALQGLKDLGQISDGQKVLINGGGGGVGAYGLQLAKMYKAEVTGVDAAEKLESMTQLGFDHVIDYKTEDFTKNGQQYDLILDCKTTRSPFAYLRALKPNGRYVTVGGSARRLLSIFFLSPFIRLVSSKKLHTLALKPNKDLVYINGLYEKGQIKCIMDGPYPFEKIPWAVKFFGEGKHRGKVIISLSQ